MPGVLGEEALSNGSLQGFVPAEFPEMNGALLKLTFVSCAFFLDRAYESQNAHLIQKIALSQLCFGGCRRR